MADEGKSKCTPEMLHWKLCKIECNSGLLIKVYDKKKALWLETGKVKDI